MKKDRTEIERRRALVGKSKIGSHCRAGEGDRPQAWFLHVDRTLSPVSGSERNRGEILLCRRYARARARPLKFKSTRESSSRYCRSLRSRCAESCALLNKRVYNYDHGENETADGAERGQKDGRRRRANERSGCSSGFPEI